MSQARVVISCEHAGNQVPGAYQHLFSGQESILESHRGWDPGALDIAKFLSDQLNAPLFYQTITRLLIEMNRSLHNASLFSEFSLSLPEAIKNQLVQDYYILYRNKVEVNIATLIQQGRKVIHVSVHTFTPVFNNVRRTADIGLLFDPDRQGELSVCTSWQKKLEIVLPALEIRLNYPYLGIEDGFTTYLRTKFTASHYIGIEIEVNQQYVGKPELSQIQQALASTFSELLLQKG
jgi:predicted N-formylglutamate amidohydrolase